MNTAGWVEIVRETNALFCLYLCSEAIFALISVGRQTPKRHFKQITLTLKTVRLEGFLTVLLVATSYSLQILRHQEGQKKNRASQWERRPNSGIKFRQRKREAYPRKKGLQFGT